MTTQEDIYFEVEADALNEAGGNKEKARKLLKDPKWIRAEAQDISKRKGIPEKRILDIFKIESDDLKPIPRSKLPRGWRLATDKLTKDIWPFGFVYKRDNPGAVIQVKDLGTPHGFKGRRVVKVEGNIHGTGLHSSFKRWENTPDKANTTALRVMLKINSGEFTEHPSNPPHLNKTPWHSGKKHKKQKKNGRYGH